MLHNLQRMAHLRSLPQWSAEALHRCCTPCHFLVFNCHQRKRDSLNVRIELLSSSAQPRLSSQGGRMHNAVLKAEGAGRCFWAIFLVYVWSALLRSALHMVHRVRFIYGPPHLWSASIRIRFIYGPPHLWSASVRVRFTYGPMHSWCMCLSFFMLCWL